MAVPLISRFSEWRPARRLTPAIPLCAGIFQRVPQFFTLRAGSYVVLWNEWGLGLQ